MAWNYSPKSFFRHAPNAMLKRYFSKNEVLSEYDFSEAIEKNIEPIYQAWLSFSATQRGEMVGIPTGAELQFVRDGMYTVAF